jgi:hypothetical protein
MPSHLTLLDMFIRIVIRQRTKILTLLIMKFLQPILTSLCPSAPNYGSSPSRCSPLNVTGPVSPAHTATHQLRHIFSSYIAKDKTKNCGPNGTRHSLKLSAPLFLRRCNFPLLGLLPGVCALPCVRYAPVIGAPPSSGGGSHRMVTTLGWASADPWTRCGLPGGHGGTETCGYAVRMRKTVGT